MMPRRSVFTLCLLASGLCAAATPKPELQARVRGATFEVVVPKPADTGVTYERAPPFELLPFTERNDKFWPVGTAFAISRDTFVSASHVLQAAISGQGGAPRLRDAEGQTYSIDRVLKFSLHQDYVVFTASVNVREPLATNRKTRLDEPVFAVGNAQGEGVVIRDGLLTSFTPEDQDGRWKWLRYSAATSPGNSGGPLLNAAGEVIGVVIGKSPGENLNYALPIEHVESGGNEASVDVRLPMRIPLMRDSIVARYQTNFPLPLPLAEFEQKFRAENLRMYRAERTRLVTEHDAELFPRGKSEKLLASVEAAYTPMILTQSEDRTWRPDDNSYDCNDLPDDGRVCTRVTAGLRTFSIRRGKPADPKFYTDRRAAMDLLLKGIDLTRDFGSDSVKVTSLGAPVREEEHRDRYGRRWRVAVFTIPYLDAHLVTLFLPTPEGYAGMTQFVPRGMSDNLIDQLRFVSDYIYVSYSGTLPQWQAFLAQPELRPAPLDRVTFTRDAAGLHFHSRRVDFDVPPALLTLSDTSIVQMQMSYALEKGAATWDVGAIYVSTDRDQKSYVGLIRQAKPVEGAGKDLTDRWAEMLDSQGAFSPERGHDSEYKKLWRRAAVGAGYRPGASVDRNASLLYEAVSVVYEPKVPRRVDDMQDLLLENVRVKER